MLPNSTVCEDSTIYSYHSPSVLSHILIYFFGICVYSVVIDCEISNNYS